MPEPRQHVTPSGAVVPLLPGVPAPEPAPPPERLRVVLELEFLPDPVPPDHRLRALLKQSLRRFRARCLRCEDVPPPAKPT